MLSFYLQITCFLCGIIPHILCAGESLQACTTPTDFIKHGIFLNVGPDSAAKHKYLQPRTPLTCSAKVPSVYLYNTDELYPIIQGDISDPHVQSAIPTLVDDIQTILDTQDIARFPPPTPNSIFAKLLAYSEQLSNELGETMLAHGIQEIDDFEKIDSDYTAAFLQLNGPVARDVFKVFLTSHDHRAQLASAVQPFSTIPEKINAAIQYIDSLPLSDEAKTPLVYCLAVDGGSRDFDFTAIATNPLPNQPITTATPYKATHDLLMASLTHTNTTTPIDQETITYFSQSFTKLISQRLTLFALITARALALVSETPEDANTFFPADKVLMSKRGADIFLANIKNMPVWQHLNASHNAIKQILTFIRANILFSPEYQYYDLQVAIRTRTHIFNDPNRMLGLYYHTILAHLPEEFTDHDAFVALHALLLHLDIEDMLKLGSALRTIIPLAGSHNLPMNQPCSHFDIQYSKKIFKQFSALASFLQYTYSESDHRNISTEHISTHLRNYLRRIFKNGYMLQGGLEYFTQFATGQANIHISSYEDAARFLRACTDLSAHSCISPCFEHLQDTIQHYKRFPHASLPNPLIKEPVNITNWNTDNATTTPDERKILLETLTPHVQPLVLHLVDLIQGNDQETRISDAYVNPNGTFLSCYTQ